MRTQAAERWWRQLRLPRLPLYLAFSSLRQWNNRRLGPAVTRVPQGCVACVPRAFCLAYDGQKLEQYRAAPIDASGGCLSPDCQGCPGPRGPEPQTAVSYLTQARSSPGHTWAWLMPELDGLCCALHAEEPARTRGGHGLLNSLTTTSRIVTAVVT